MPLLSSTFMTSIRVAFLCEFPTLLGGERSLLAFLARHRLAGIEPTVIAPGSGPLAAALADAGIRRIDWPPGGRHDHLRLAEILRRLGVDLVHANSLMTAGAAAAAGEILGIPAVAHVRDVMRLSAARRERLTRLGALIAVSEAVADWLKSENVAAGKVSRIYNAVDVDALRSAAQPGAVRKQLELDPDVPVIGCIGQIALRKGQNLFLDAAAIIARTLDDVHFLVVGQRHSRKPESVAFETALHDKAKCPALAGRVHFLGYRDDVPSVLADLDVLAVPSRQEPLSRVLLEGLALGVACVATAVGGSPEILAGGQYGILTEPDDPQAIAEAIQQLLANSTLRERFTKAGPHRVQTAFAPHQQARVIRNLYEKLLA